jgi:hypothetical protein
VDSLNDIVRFPILNAHWFKDSQTQTLRKGMFCPIKWAQVASSPAFHSWDSPKPNEFTGGVSANRSAIMCRRATQNWADQKCPEIIVHPLILLLRKPEERNESDKLSKPKIGFYPLNVIQISNIIL